MFKTLLSILTIALILLLLSCTSTKISDHIRVFDNDSLVYHFTKDSADILLTYEDTIVTRMLVRKGVVRGHPYENYDVFYFDTPNHPDSGIYDVFTNDIPLNGFTYFLIKENYIWVKF